MPALRQARTQGSIRMNHSTSTGQRAHRLEAQITKAVQAKYWLHLPADYRVEAGSWPTILFLHGAGERGDDLERVKTHGLAKRCACDPGFPFIVISPLCPAGLVWDTDVLVALLDDVASRCAVDPDRVYVTGLSMGGYGTWALAVAHPERFAAIAPICGWGNRLLAYRLRNMPIWVFHGARDPVVPLRESEDMVATLREQGSDVRFTVYPDAEHDAWTRTYANPALYDWFLQHRR